MGWLITDIHILWGTTVLATSVPWDTVGVIAMDMDTLAFLHRMESPSVVEDMDTRHLDTIRFSNLCACLTRLIHAHHPLHTYNSIPVLIHCRQSRDPGLCGSIRSLTLPGFAILVWLAYSLITKTLCVNQLQPCDIRPPCRSHEHSFFFF